MSISFIKKSNIDVVAKIFGTNEISTIYLDDLIVPGEVYTGEALKVNIVAMTWTGHFNTVISISRNNENVLTLPTTAPNYVNFVDKNLTQNENNTKNIVVSITGGQGEVWIRLHKISGYYSIIEDVDATVWDKNLMWDSNLIWE